MAEIDPKPGPPVFRTQDNVGALRHIAIFAVDGLVIYFVGVGFTFVSVLAYEAQPLVAVWLPGILFVVFTWWYLAVLKPSRFRTPGYWIADAKIITIQGDAPSPWRMSLRLFWTLFWWMGWPMNFVLDLSWAAIDVNRQMLRDVIAETRLIRNKAQPTATGKVTHSLVLGLGIAIFYAEVRECHATRNQAAES